MEPLSILYLLLLLHILPTTATNLITAHLFEPRGQRVCRVGKERPCYKLAYFSEPRRRLNFDEAELACRRDGGELLSLETAAEQSVIEQLISEIRPIDGDFWIGLRRNHGDQDSSLDCSAQYYWVDGSKATYRNWHSDEPSCGYEVCVVMYHQPSAPPSMGALYMFQWNDDNCETRNNFICKYTEETPLEPSPSSNSTQTDALPTPVLPWDPAVHNKPNSTARSLIYIVPPILLLLLLLLMAVCCFKLLTRWRRRKTPVCQIEPGLRPSPTSSDVYNVIRSQKEDDLASTRPHTKNTSFLSSSPDTPTGDYDNLGGQDTESGFATLASTESGFLSLERGGTTADIYDHSLGRAEKTDLSEMSLCRSGKRDTYDTSLGRTGKRDSYDTSLGRSGKRDSYDTSLGHAGKRDSYDTSLGRSGKRDSYDTSLGRSGKDSYDTSLGRSGKDSYDTSLGRSGKRDSYDTSLGHAGKRDSYDTSLGRSGKRDSYDTSLGRSGKDSYDTSLWRSENREFYDRGLGRRTTKSEHYSSGSFVEQEMYGLRREKSDLHNVNLGTGGSTVKADLYQTYHANRKEGSYQTKLGNYRSQNPYQTNMDYYQSELGFSGSRRYFNEAQWVNAEGY